MIKRKSFLKRRKKMLDITRLLADTIEEDSIRYAKDCAQTTKGTRKGRGPVVAWNITNRCNYKCSHCYANSSTNQEKDELTLEEIKEIVNDLAEYKVPVILLSGGEPLFRKDIFPIIEYIRLKGIRVSLSTNGSLIDEKRAVYLKNLGVSYVGISLDGRKETNDEFRGIDGAYENSLRAVENCNQAEVKVGLRFTMQKRNYQDIPYILDKMEEYHVNRICFYHLVPSGRGRNIADQLLSQQVTRNVLDILYQYAKTAMKKGEQKEILTVANHCDGPYIYMKVKKENDRQAEDVFQRLINNRGNRSGSAIANIDSQGNVYPDQFTRFLPLGNVKKAPFHEIWEGQDKVLKQLRNRTEYLKGRCVECKWMPVCNGNLRARAYASSGDLWGEDIGCYLTDEEIG